MKKSTLRKYAKLIAKMGANVQKGQPVILNVSADQYEFATLVAEECYKLGAKYVRTDWSYQPMTKLAYRHQSLKTLSTVPVWKEEQLKLMVEELPCRIFILSDDPNGLKGVNVEKMQKANMAVGKVTKPYRNAIEAKHQWTIAAVPSPAWAKKVFPDLPKNKAVQKLWDAILATVRVSDDPANDPVAEWERHNADLRRRCDWLNAQRFDYVTYKSANGTDFRADLMPRGLWCGGEDTTIGGVSYNANMPTEEVFTSPVAGKAEGKLVATKPLSYQGQLIDKFWIRFENGRAVEWDAETGKDLLTRMIGMDENAGKLGELALIPCDSPINNSGILFYETLFDENASCHVALGEGFPECVEGHENMTMEECWKEGINESLIHVDFMIGAPDLCITGYKNGKATPIFVNGEWAE